MRFVFYPAQAGKPWNGDTLKKEALGGSETAVVYMARELAKLGHEVIVFTRDTPGEYDDVIYLPFDSARTILLTTPVDVLVCSRDALPALWTNQARVKALWSHDLPQGPLPDVFDVYFFVSNWQAQVYAQQGFVNQQKIRVSPNGIDLSLFSAPKAFYPHFTESTQVELTWTSNPERGLWYAGEVLQLVRKTFPKALLHVYGRNAVYGWDSSYEGNYLPDNMDGVVLHDAATKADLAEALQFHSDLFLYPTWWPETFSISCLEAQAAGLPVVSNAFGALPETVQGGFLVPGRAGVDVDFNLMADIIVDLLRDGETRKDTGQRGRQFAEKLTWTNMAQMWHEMFTSGMGLKV